MEAVMRGLAIIAAASLPACFFVDSGPEPVQADAILFYPPDARIDGAPDAAFDPQDCTTALPCPAADPNRVTVCGRIHDVETGAPIDPLIAGALCRDGVTDGACALHIEPYDALSFAQDTSIPPQGYDASYLDTCGRYRFENVIRPGFGFVGLGVDDIAGRDDYALGGAATSTVSGGTYPDVPVFAITHATDASWTSQAGLTGGSFVERGVILGRFTRDGAPVAGVVITEGGQPDTANDFYFSDPAADPATRRTISTTQNATGANGSVLLITSDLVPHSGTGGETDGCTWDSALAGTIGGVMLLVERVCE